MTTFHYSKKPFLSAHNINPERIIVIRKRVRQQPVLQCLFKRFARPSNANSRLHFNVKTFVVHYYFDSALRGRPNERARFNTMKCIRCHSGRETARYQLFTELPGPGRRKYKIVSYLLVHFRVRVRFSQTLNTALHCRPRTIVNAMQWAPAAAEQTSLQGGARRFELLFRQIK